MAPQAKFIIKLFKLSKKISQSAYWIYMCVVMRPNRWILFGIFLVFLFNVGASPLMPLDKLEKYVQKKIKRNNQVLKIKSKHLGDQGAQFLAESSLLQNVTILALIDTMIGDEGIRALANSKNLTQVTILQLGNNRISDVGVKEIANSKTFSNIELSLIGQNLLDSRHAESDDKAVFSTETERSLIGKVEFKF